MSNVADKVDSIYEQKAYQDGSGPYHGFIIYPKRIEFQNSLLWGGKNTLYFDSIANVEAVGNGILSFKRIVIKTKDGHEYEVRTKDNENVRAIILGLKSGS